MSGVTSRVPRVFDRQQFTAELVAALVAGDEIDFHFAMKLAGEEEREAAIDQIRTRIATVDARRDQIEARMAELRVRHG